MTTKSRGENAFAKRRSLGKYYFSLTTVELSPPLTDRLTTAGIYHGAKKSFYHRKK